MSETVETAIRYLFLSGLALAFAAGFNAAFRADIIDLWHGVAAFALYQACLANTKASRRLAP